MRASLFLLSTANALASTTSTAVQDTNSVAVEWAMFRNGSVDECWSSWDKYYSASQLAELGTYTIETPYTSSGTITISAYSGVTEAFTSTIHTTETVFDGEFPILTQKFDTTSATTIIGQPKPATTSTFLRTVTPSSKVFPSNTIAKPSCTLPSYVSQCEDQWERWITTQLAPAPTPPPDCDVFAGIGNTRPVPDCQIAYSSAKVSYSKYVGKYPPPCTEASVGGSLCQSVRDDYVRQGNDKLYPSQAAGAFYLSAGYLGSFKNIAAQDYNVTYSWPTSATLGSIPSCTLGCGRCAVTGGTVQLIYWPATTTTKGNITLSSTTPITIETLGTTFTSPTMYISYGNVYAADGCRKVGSALMNTIVAIPTSSRLSSIAATPLPCIAHVQGAFTQEATITASFNITDLNEPVPQSIYTSQPWCATYIFRNGCERSCPSAISYKPILVVPEEVLQNLQPEWSECYGDIRGVYDPPIALQPVDTINAPTLPHFPATAVPVSGPGLSMPSHTSIVRASDDVSSTSQDDSPTTSPEKPSEGSGPYYHPSGGLPFKTSTDSLIDPYHVASADPTRTSSEDHLSGTGSQPTSAAHLRLSVSLGALIQAFLVATCVL